MLLMLFVVSLSMANLPGKETAGSTASTPDGVETTIVYAYSDGTTGYTVIMDGCDLCVMVFNEAADGTITYSDNGFCDC